MRTLKQFIQDNNRWIALCGKQGMTFPLAQSDVDDLARTLDGKLSPENLYCDGEITAAEANRKYNKLARVYRELCEYCDSNGLREPTVYEL